MSGCHRFRVGEFEWIAVTDGTFSSPAGWMFSNVPQARFESRLKERNLSQSSESAGLFEFFKDLFPASFRRRAAPTAPGAPGMAQHF
jgi:hypothetical protein